MSPDSVDVAADLGARMVMFSQRPWDDQAASVQTYRERFIGAHGSEPGPPIVCDFVYCDRDQHRAEDMAHRYIAGYLTSVMEHYELQSDHLKQAKGYESYGNSVELLRAIGLEKLCDMYLGVNVWGTPDQIVERLRARREVIGDHDLTCCFRFAGLPYEDAEASMRLFAEEVLPVVQTRSGRSVDDGGVDERLQLVAEVERARRRELGHEHDGEVLARVDPEDGRRPAAPHEVARRPDHLRAGRAEPDRDGEAEARAVEADLAVSAGHGERTQLAVVGQVVRRHQLDGLAPEHTRAVERRHRWPASARTADSRMVVDTRPPPPDRKVGNFRKPLRSGSSISTSFLSARRE